jgi:hypothetical protein
VTQDELLDQGASMIKQAARIDAVKANLRAYLPDDLGPLGEKAVDDAANLAALAELVIEKQNGEVWPGDLARDFLALTDRLARTLCLIGTDRIAGCAAEQLAARAFVVADNLLEKMSGSGNA